MDRREAFRIVHAAEKYDRAGRGFGGTRPLGGTAIEILRLMANLMHRQTGRLDPSIEWLMQQLARSREGIVRALKALRAHGFLDWLRRYVETGNTGKGPRVQQTSNAYRLCLPPQAARLLPQPPPMPDDFAHQRAAHDQERAEQEATLSPTERTRLITTDDDPDFAATLLRFAAAFEAHQRESSDRTESGTRIIP